MSNEQNRTAEGRPLERPVGRPAEYVMTDGTAIVRTGGKRLRTYAVIFKGGEAIEVDVEASRRDTRPFWRLVWMKGDAKMGFAAAIAIRAAIAQAESSGKTPNGQLSAAAESRPLDRVVGRLVNEGTKGQM